MPILANYDSCTGCTACAAACPNGCIAMKADENGFLHPVVDGESCIGCGLCENSCPVLQPPGRAQEDPEAFAAYTVDETVRLASSSGGIFTELGREILRRGGVVYGAAYDDALRVVHIPVETEDGLDALRGAKYAQSDLQDTFRQIRTQLKTRPVLFSGTPCQAAGLKAFLGTMPENLYVVDFVCHGVPSPMVWQQYLQSLGNVRRVNLRAKDTGWSRYRYCHRIETEEKTLQIPSGQSLYMRLFVGDYVNREACASCHFKGYGRCSDLTLGDFWGIWNIAPEMDDDRGTSLVLCQSSRGRELLEQIRPRLVLKPVTLEEASRENGALIKPAPMHPRRQEALEQIRSGAIRECESWFRPPEPTLAQRLRGLVRRLRKGR